MGCGIYMWPNKITCETDEEYDNFAIKNNRTEQVTWTFAVSIS